MIRFKCAPKPAGFVSRVENAGKRWLAKNPMGRPRDLWSPFKLQLAEAFRDLCAYSAMHAPIATVDDFVSVSEDRRLAYAWSNYRYCAGWLNAAKQNLRSKELLDPFEIEDGWFEILLPSLQLVMTDAVPKRQRARAETMLRRLHLSNDERVIRQRREWLRMYEDRELSLEGPARKAPLIALAVAKREQAAGRKSPPGKWPPGKSPPGKSPSGKPRRAPRPRGSAKAPRTRATPRSAKA
jgi:hypothetical protein